MSTRRLWWTDSRRRELKLPELGCRVLQALALALARVLGKDRQRGPGGLMQWY